MFINNVLFQNFYNEKETNNIINTSFFFAGIAPNKFLILFLLLACGASLAFLFVPRPDSLLFEAT